MPCLCEEQHNGQQPPQSPAPCFSLARGLTCSPLLENWWHLILIPLICTGPWLLLKFTLPLPPFPTKTVASSFCLSRGCPEGLGERRGEAPSSWKAPGKGMPSRLEPPLLLDSPPGHSAGLSSASFAHLLAFVRLTVAPHRPPFSISSPS